MKYKLWDKKKQRFLKEDEMCQIALCSDGKLYEFDLSCNGGWDYSVNREDVTDQYEIQYIQE